MGKKNALLFGLPLAVVVAVMFLLPRSELMQGNKKEEFVASPTRPPAAPPTEGVSTRV